ncbi:MAG: hypothetical protein KF775_19515 [Cyclobacteriaceae bacterium]|nr:hypothetical protein [Cyclobacteriaceae bacterium]
MRGKILCKILWLTACGLAGTSYLCLAQDSTRSKPIDQLKQNKITQQVVGSISRTPPPDSVTTLRSEKNFLPYEGKIVRHIIINRIGFDRTVQDTTRRIRTTVARLANKLHNDTKAWVIRENIFIREGTPLNAFRVADNERYLRDLDFILDSKIYVAPLSEESDSVDLLIITRDVFSLGASFSPRGVTEYRLRVQEANLAGMGQRVQVSALLDTDRTPAAGYEYLYRKTNLFGSFVNATASYTELNTGRSIGNENESAYLFRLDRPLFHPFARWAGAVEISKNWSTNTSGKESAAFARYTYRIHDAWAGYTFGFKKNAYATHEDRNRRFVAVRAYQTHFSQLPQVIPLQDKFIYTNRKALLGQATFFKQDFYKTNFVLGFGRTEDIPFGYRLSFTSGWEQELETLRPYTGAELTLSTVNRNGTFYTYTAKLGNYWNHELVEDGLAQFGVSRYSRVYQLGKTNVRHQGEVNYAFQINQTQKRFLDIRDGNGVQGLRPDSLWGTQRLRLSTETVVFTPWKVAGFHLAPVTRIDLAYLSKESALFKKQNFFSGFSVAMRARNENLIFNTVEARVYYYPATPEAIEPFRFEFRTNLRIKYPTGLVMAPATVYDP